MKKIIMAFAVVFSVISAFATADVYDFRSILHVYSLKKQAYVSTSLNGKMYVDDGEISLILSKKDTKEAFDLAAGIETVDTNTTTNTEAAVESEAFAIITGKKNAVGALIFEVESEDSRLTLVLAGNGIAKTKMVGCTPCGDGSSCTKIKKLQGAYVGTYDCACCSAQHFSYDMNCEVSEERDQELCPIWGTWTATLKTVDGAKYK